MQRNDIRLPLEGLRRNLGRARRLLFEPNRVERVRTFLERRRQATVLPSPSPAIDRARRANRALLERELREESAVLTSQPTVLMIDPATACNLKCPFCPTGAGYTGLPKEILTPEMFEKVVSHLQVDLLEEVNLFHLGEPFLNRHLLEYIRYFADRGIRTEVSTNFSLRDYDDEFLERLVASGLTSLIVSIDGASQHSYEKYRIGGNFDRVVGNMKRLAEVKSTTSSAVPRVSYKMLLHRYNEHEVESAKEVAASCGAEFLLNERFWCPDEHAEEWVPKRILEARGEPIPQGYSNEPEEVISTYCRQMWDSVIVNSDGTVFPCCLIYQREYAVGNIVEQDVEEIRNGATMIQLRRFVTDAGSAAPAFQNYCQDCPSRWCAVKKRTATAHA